RGCGRTTADSDAGAFDLHFRPDARHCRRTWRDHALHTSRTMVNDALSSNAQPIERRLATIMMADVAGYSRMMGENEEGTVAVLRGHREIFDALLKVHRGRVFNTAGDAILAEFPSAVEAVRCATEIQTALRTRNEHLPPERRMWFRIGINLGDVIVQGDDLLGDGVNRRSRNPAASAFRAACTTRSRTSSRCRSGSSAKRPSRTSP